MPNRIIDYAAENASENNLIDLLSIITEITDDSLEFNTVNSEEELYQDIQKQLLDLLSLTEISSGNRSSKESITDMILLMLELTNGYAKQKTKIEHYYKHESKTSLGKPNLMNQIEYGEDDVTISEFLRLINQKQIPSTQDIEPRKRQKIIQETFIELLTEVSLLSTGKSEEKSEPLKIEIFEMMAKIEITYSSQVFIKIKNTSEKEKKEIDLKVI